MAKTFTSPPNAMTVSNDKSNFFYRWGLFVARQRWWVLGGWLVLLLAAGLFIPQFQKSLTFAGFEVNQSDSQQVAKLLKTRFSQQFAEQDVLVFHSATMTLNEPAYQQTVQIAIKQIAGLPQVAAVFSPTDPEAQGQISSDGHSAFALIGINGNDDQRLALASRLEEAARRASTGQVEMYITGYSPISADLADQELGDMEQAEIFGLPVALVVLMLAFASVIAAFVPLLLAMVGIVFTLGLLGAISLFSGNFNLGIENILTMIGLGVGIDYTLFIITRFREELTQKASREEAVAASMATAGKTVFFSGGTVLIALSGLLLVNSKVFTDMAVGAMAVVGVMVLAALSLLPAGLALLGEWVNRLGVPFLKKTTRPQVKNLDQGFWAGWTRVIMRRPLLWIGIITVLLLLATAPVFQLKLGTDLGTASLGKRPAGRGLDLLAQYFSKGTLSPTQVLVERTNGTIDDATLEQVARLTAVLEKDPAVARVDSLTKTLDQLAGGHSLAALKTLEVQPEGAQFLGYYLNWHQGDNITLLNVTPKVAIDSPEVEQLITRIRHQYAPSVLASQTDLKVLVGGTSAEITDLADEMLSKLPWVLGLVLVLSFGLLAIAFRSIFLPLKAVLMNLLSIGTSYGLLVLVFQKGAGEQILNFHSPGTIQVYLPMLAFAILFGLSMDYEVFLIGRMKEEWRHSQNNELAVSRGLEHTAQVITSAAAIMVAVFAAFAFTTILEIKQLGFALAIAILVDATLIRVILVPAAMKLMGHWNWWFPRFLDRITPHLEL
jgi:RND superfamily putative drug exporter